MKNKYTKKDIIGISLAGGIFILIVFVLLFFFGGTILSILGFKYDSLWSLAKFFAIYMIIGTPLDFIIECSLKVIKDLKGLSESQYAIIYGFMDISINTVLIGVLEWVMSGIECSLFTALSFSTIFFIVSYVSDKKANEEDNKESI